MKEPLVTNIRGLATMLAVSIGTAKRLIYSNEIPTFLVGRRRLIPVDAVRDYVARRIADAAEAK
jgi:excisionase family DNA binding protein